MSIVTQKPDNKKVVYFIQDYSTNKLTRQKLKDHTINIDLVKDRWEFIEKLQDMGVDFKNYEFIQ
jgi:DNA-dependent RNA polymerase auxiliary subunit epsilon